MDMSQFQNVNMANNTNLFRLPQGSAVPYSGTPAPQSVANNTMLVNGLQAPTSFSNQQVYPSHNLPIRSLTTASQQDNMLQGNIHDMTAMQPQSMQPFYGQHMINNQGVYLNQPYMQNMYAYGNAQTNNASMAYGSAQANNVTMSALASVNGHPGTVQQLANMNTMPNTSARVMASRSTISSLTPDQVLLSKRKALFVAHELTKGQIDILSPATVHELFSRISKMFSPTPVTTTLQTNHAVGSIVPQTTGAQNLTDKGNARAARRNPYMGGVPLDDIRAPPRQIRNATKSTRGRKRKRSTSSSTVTPRTKDQTSPTTLEAQKATTAIAAVASPLAETTDPVATGSITLKESKQENNNNNNNEDLGLQQVEPQALGPAQPTEQDISTDLTTLLMTHNAQQNGPSSGPDWTVLFGDPEPFNGTEFNLNDSTFEDFYDENAPTDPDTTKDLLGAAVSAS